MTIFCPTQNIAQKRYLELYSNSNKPIILKQVSECETRNQVAGVPTMAQENL